MRWQVDDIYEWFKNHKHYCRKVRNAHLDSFDDQKGSQVGYADVFEEAGVVEGSPNCHSMEDCFDEQLNEMELCAAEEFVSQGAHISNGQEKGHQKRRRISSSKVVEAISQGLCRKQKQKTLKEEDVEDRLEKVTNDAETSVFQGLQLKGLTKNLKKIVAMVVMGLNRIYDVIPNLCCFISKTFLEFEMKLKKDDPRQSRMQRLYLDFVVWWALKEFKVGIKNPPPLRNGMQELFVENVKKLF